MKSKKIQKKLVLNKQTISTIGKDEMAHIQAGDIPTFVYDFNFTPFASFVKFCKEEADDKRPSYILCL